MDFVAQAFGMRAVSPSCFLESDLSNFKYSPYNYEPKPRNPVNFAF
jgi:hypothetical protein